MKKVNKVKNVESQSESFILAPRDLQTSPIHKKDVVISTTPGVPPHSASRLAARLSGR